MTIYMGVDPGGTVGIALYEPSVRFDVWQMPVAEARSYFKEWTFQMFAQTMARQVCIGI